MKVVVGILAGGIGERMGMDLPKQFLKINGTPILIHSVKKFLDYPILISIKEDWMDYTRELLRDYGLLDKVELIKGGRTRQLSSFNVVMYFRKLSPDVILIHDAARCLVSKNLIEKLIGEMEKKWSNVDGILPYVPVVDSLVEINKKINYIDRSKIGRIQTPQVFKFQKILEAHLKFFKEKRYDFKDEGSMILEIGGNLGIIEGEEKNIKISTPLDLEIAAKLVEYGK